MKTNKYIYRTMAAAAVALPLSLFSFSSCSDEDQKIPTDTKGQVVFTASVSEAPTSRAEVAYTPATGQLTVYGNSWVSAVKASYGYNSNTEGWTCNSREPLFWKDITGTNEYLFYAVAPSEPASDPAVLKDQSSIENFTASDLLVARSTVSAKETAVPFVLKHVLSQMEINLTTSEGDEKLSAEELASAVVTIDGLKNAYTLEAGTTTEAPVIATATGDAVNGMKPCQDESKNTFRYITVPQTVTTDPGMTLNFTVNVNGKELKYGYNHKPTFAAGKKNIYNITITKSNLKVSKITVTDWATGAEVQGKAMNITVTAQDGTAADITTLSLWNTKDTDMAAYVYDAATGWTTDTPFYIEDYEDADLFFARHTPVAADATTDIKDVLGNTTGSTISNGGIALTLEHLMSKLTIALNRGESFSEDVDLTGATVTLPSVLPTAKITDANVAVATGDAKTYTLSPATAYLFAPQTIAAGTELTVTLKNGNQYKTTLAEDIKLAQGTANKVTITLNPTELAVAFSVKEWPTGANAEGTAINITVTAQDGTDANITSLNLWNTKDADKATYVYDATTGWTTDIPFYMEDYEDTDLFFARHTPAAADTTTSIKDVLGNTIGMAINNGGIALTLEHLMSKLTIALARGASFSEDVDLTGATITLPGILPTAEITDANVVTATGDAKIYTLSPATAYLFAPQTIAAGTELTVTLKNGNQYKTALAEDIKLAQGTANKVTITLNPTELAVAFSVKEWPTGAKVETALTIVTTGTADELTDNCTFSTLNIFVDALNGTSFEYTKNNEGTWTSTNPLYLDELVATSKLYAQTVNSEADAITGLTDILGTDATPVKGGIVAFTFRHLMAQMNINLIKGENFTPSLDEAVITTPNMNIDYTVAIDDNNNMTAVAGTATQAYTLTDADTHLVVPQTLAKGSVFTVKLTNGNVYNAILTKDVVLKAGANTTVSLILNPTEAGVSATVTSWGEAVAGATIVQLEGINSEIGINDITEAGELALTYVQNGVLAQTATFGFSNNNWSCTTPLYWDEITPGQQPYTFAALFSPKADGLVEKDYLVGLGKAIAHGQQVQLGNMAHAMAKMTITLKAGEGVTADELTDLTNQVNLTKSTKVTVNANGTALIDLAQESETVSFTNAKEFFVAPQTLGDANVITLTRPNGNKYTMKLTDLKDGNSNPIFINGEVLSGKHYTITLNVNETTVGITASISAWTEVSGSGTATPEF